MKRLLTADTLAIHGPALVVLLLLIWGCVFVESRIALIVVMNTGMVLLFLAKPLLNSISIHWKWLAFPGTVAEWLILTAVIVFLNWLAFYPGKLYAFS